VRINPLYAELNPLCHLLALLRAHHFLHVNRIRVKKTITLVLTKVLNCQSGSTVQQQHKLLREGHLCLCVPASYFAYRRLGHVTFTFVISNVLRVIKKCAKHITCTFSHQHKSHFNVTILFPAYYTALSTT
jgi:hypothetical protein